MFVGLLAIKNSLLIIFFGKSNNEFSIDLDCRSELFFVTTALSRRKMCQANVQIGFLIFYVPA